MNVNIENATQILDYTEKQAKRTREEAIRQMQALGEALLKRAAAASGDARPEALIVGSLAQRGGEIDALLTELKAHEEALRNLRAIFTQEG